MTFTGFNLKYPEYEVITPQTGNSFTVRSLNVQEEEHLKGSLMTPQKITDHLNRCIYESIVKKPAAIKDFDSFMKGTTLKDRDALLYGLYHISYGEIRDYDITCSSCKKEYPVTVQASDTFTFTQYPGKSVLTKIEKVELPVSKGVSAFVRQPTLADEAESMKGLASRPNANNEIVTETLIIAKFEEDIPEKTSANTYEDRSDILDAYLTLPARDKRAIYKAYRENFGKYGVELKMKSYCQYCGSEEVIDIDLVSAFFRVLYSV